MRGIAHLRLLGLVMAAPCVAHGQSVRPVPTGPVNVIRPSVGNATPVQDTSRTVFFVGPRPPAPLPADVPGSDLVVWRSSSPIVRGVAGADASYLHAFEPLGNGARQRAAIAGVAAPPILLGGGWGPWLGAQGPTPDYSPTGPRQPTFPGQMMRPTIGGVSWDIPATSPVHAPPSTAIYPMRRR